MLGHRHLHYIIIHFLILVTVHSITILIVFVLPRQSPHLQAALSASQPILCKHYPTWTTLLLIITGANLPLPGFPLLLLLDLLLFLLLLQLLLLLFSVSTSAIPPGLAVLGVGATQMIGADDLVCVRIS